MNLIGALIGALVGGLIGGAIWVGVGYGTGYEVGYIAWGIGLLAGLGVAIGGKGQAGIAGGVLAVAVAIVTILVSKYLVIELVLEKELRSSFDVANANFPTPDDREFWVGYTADRLVEAQESAGKPVQWPAGVEPDQAMTQAQYPPAIWKDAEQRWDALSPAARTDYCQQAKVSITASFDQAMGAIKSEMHEEGFLQSFGLYDLLWAFLAIGTAFKVGSGEAKTA